MITRPLPKFDTEKAEVKWYFRKELLTCDRRRAFDALAEVDTALEPHGLEIIVYSDGGDPYFEIVKREEVE